MNGSADARSGGQPTVEDDEADDSAAGPEPPPDFDDDAEDEEGRFFGGGITKDTADVLDLIDERDDGVNLVRHITPLDEILKQRCLQNSSETGEDRYSMGPQSRFEL